MEWTVPRLGSGIDERFNLENEHWTGELISRRENKLNFYHYQYLIKIKNFTEKDNECVEKKLQFISNVVTGIAGRCRQLLTHPADKIQLVFNSNPNFMMAPLATPFMKRKDFTNSFLLDKAATLLNSNESFALSADFHISVKLLKKEEIVGGGRSHARSLSIFEDYDHFLRGKRSVMLLPDRKNGKKNLCFAKATQILLAQRRFKRKQQTKKTLLQYKRNESFLETSACNLQRSAKVEIGKKIKITDIPKFEEKNPR